jgi:hypothetical protein
MAILEQLSSFSFAVPQFHINAPVFFMLSFVVCITRLDTTGAVTDQVKICSSLIQHYPYSFCYFNTSNRIFLFVLYEHTSNFMQLELNRQTLIDRVLEKNSPLPPFKFGIIHHDLTGLTSSFLEASQVYYFNKLRTPCTFFEEISSPPGQLLKQQKLMEIEVNLSQQPYMIKKQPKTQYLQRYKAAFSSKQLQKSGHKNPFLTKAPLYM